MGKARQQRQAQQQIEPFFGCPAVVLIRRYKLKSSSGYGAHDYLRGKKG